MVSRRLTLAFALLALAAGAGGCGDDDSTISTFGASGATGADSTGDPSADADAKAAALTAQTALETYATDNNGSYAGASAEELAKIEPSLPSGDLEVVSTDSSYTISVLSASGTTFSLDGGGGPTDRTCEPPGGSGCSESGDWG